MCIGTCSWDSLPSERVGTAELTGESGSSINVLTPVIPRACFAFELVERDVSCRSNCTV